MNIDRKLSLLIALWILDKIIMVLLIGVFGYEKRTVKGIIICMDGY